MQDLAGSRVRSFSEGGLPKTKNYCWLLLEVIRAMAQFCVWMKTTPLPLTHLIHDSLAIVMCFCLSRQRTHKALKNTFKGDWEFLRKVVYDRAENQATKAVIELALFLRILDDNNDFSEREWKDVEGCGSLIMRDGTVEDISPRQIANKIIHAKSYEWKEEETPGFNIGPELVCYGRDDEKWERADIEIFALAAICGQLAS